MKVGPVECNTNLMITIKLQRDCLPTPEAPHIIIRWFVKSIRKVKVWYQTLLIVVTQHLQTTLCCLHLVPHLCKLSWVFVLPILRIESLVAPKLTLLSSMHGGIVSNYPFVWKLGNTLIQMTKIHLGIPIMSDIKNT